MRTLYKIFLGFIPLLLTASVLQSSAQTPQYTYAVTGGNNIYPFKDASNNKVQWVYVPSTHFPTATVGLMDSIYFRANEIVPGATYTNLTIKIGPTTLTQFPAGSQPWATGLTTVYSAPTTTFGAIPNQGWFGLALNTPYLFDPGQNFIVEVSQTSYVTGIQIVQDNLANARLFGSLASPTGSNGSGRANLGFHLAPAAPCASNPTAGTTIASSSTVCSGAPVGLYLTGNSVATGLSYQLLSAPAVGGPYSTASGVQSSSAFALNPTATAFYRVRVVCANGGGVDTSTPVQVTVPTLFPAGTYTINNSQPTGGTNFNNFTDAVSAIACGITGPVVFNVVNNATPYTDQVTIPHIPTTSSTNTITFNGNGATIAFSSTSSALRAAFTLNGADWIRIRRLNIIASPGTSNYGAGVAMTLNANNNIVDSCNITVDSNTASTNFTGITVSGSLTSPTTSGSDCDSNTITNNVINGGYYGITMLGGTSAATASLGNVISNNVVKNFYFYGIYAGYVGNTLIERNDISRPTRNTYTTFYGIYHFSTTGAGTNVRITRNRIHDPSGTQPTAAYTFYGIFHSGADATAAAPHEVSNNLLYNLRLDGPIYAIYNSSSDHVKYWHNTVSADDAQSTTTDLTRGFYQLTAAAGIELKNNIFSLTRGGTGSKHAAYWGTTITTANAFSARNNVYNVTNPGSGGIGYYNSTNYPTLAAYQTATSQDTGSITADPLFASPVNNNFTPNAAAVNNVGVPLPQVPVDLFGTTRSTTTPDPGAIEFTPAACTTPPTAGTAVASDTTVCAGMNVCFDAPGTSFGTGLTFQWQTSPTLAGTYTSVGTSSSQTSYCQAVNTTAYFRVAVTCGTSTTYSTPVRVQVLGTMAGGTYTINAGAPASATNFQSFSAAIDAMQCGITGPVVLNVVTGSGPYNEQVIFPPTISGTSSTNTITVNGNGNAINFNTALPNINGLSRAAILLNGVDWVTLNNLVVNVSNGGQYGFGIQLYNDADNNTVRGCTVTVDSNVTSSLYAGMVISGSLTSAAGTGDALCDSNRFLNNTVSGGYYCVTNVGNSATAPNYNNVFRGNTVRDFFVYGIYGAYNNGWIVDSNSVSRPDRSQISTFYGVALSTSSLGATVSRNRVHTSAGGNSTTSYSMYGLYVTGSDASAAQPNMWVNNMVYNINGNASAYGIYNSGSDNQLYRHNTVALDDSNYAGSNLTYGLYQTTAASGIDVRNNIFSLRRAGSGAKTVLFFNTATTTFTSNYNILHLNGGSGSPIGTGWIGTTTAGTGYATLTAWQQGSGKDTASIDLDPMFSGGAAGTNLTPTNVAVDNLGQPVGVTTDIFGSPRSLVTPDMGAIEWSFIPPCNGPTALTDVAAATTANIGWTASSSTNVGYELTYSTSSTPPTGPGTPIASTSVSLSGLTPGTTYYYCIRTVCGPTSYSSYVCDSFTTCVPPASTLIAQGSPTPNAVSICQGDTAMLKAPGGTGNTYLFLLNGATAGSGASTDSTFHAMQAGSYTVVVTNATGCYDTSDAVQVTVNPLPTPNITQTSYNQLTTTTTFSSYQWNLAGAPISGATSQTYTAPPTGNGTYTVTVTDANGCRATSSPYNLTTASVAAAAGAVAHIRIFPNPTTGRIFIESSEEVRAGVWTLDGRRLIEVEKAKMVDLSNLASGVYMLRLTDANGTVLATERVTKTN